MVLRQITAEHANEDYFKKAEIASHDIGFGVDLWVDREKWQASGKTVRPSIDKVPICVLLVG